ncbi:MAG: hypothetical protein ACK5JU_03490, partial [Bacteroidales bacterium]
LDQIKDIVSSLIPVFPSAFFAYLFVTYLSMNPICSLLCGLLIYVFLIILFGVISQNKEIRQVSDYFIAKMAR